MSANFQYSVYVYPENGHGIKLVGPTSDFYKAFAAYSEHADNGFNVKLFDDNNENGMAPRFQSRNVA